MSTQQTPAESDALVRWAILALFGTYFVNFLMLPLFAFGVIGMARWYWIFVPSVFYLTLMFATWVFLAVTGKLSNRN